MSKVKSETAWWRKVKENLSRLAINAKKFIFYPKSLSRCVYVCNILITTRTD
jgi:hypothetical protein